MNTKKEVLLNRIIFILSIIGMVIAIYVTQSFIRKTNIVCVNTGCEFVRKHPASYILGIPVPAFGLVGYSLLALLAFLRTTVLNKKDSKVMIRDSRLHNAILGISGGGVLFVSWFTYTELFVIKAICTWCAVSAVNMVAIFILSLKNYQYKNKTRVVLDT